MQVAQSIGRAVLAVPKTIANACPSTWINWICYWGAISAIRSPAFDSAILRGGHGFFVLSGGLAAFFASVVLVQRRMSLSLLASSFGKPTRLITTGVFRYTRNPIYVAFLIPLASIAYFSPEVAVAAMVLYITAMNAYLVRIEEAALVARFGDDYRQYQREVPRWLF